MDKIIEEVKNPTVCQDLQAWFLIDKFFCSVVFALMPVCWSKGHIKEIAIVRKSNG